MLSFSSRIAWGLVLLIVVPRWANAGATLEEASALRQEGKLKEAHHLYHVAAGEFLASGDQHNLAIALSAAGDISISLGDYTEAISDVEKAVKLRRSLSENENLGADLNTLARAYQYLGNYPEALKYYEEALVSDRRQGDAIGQVTRLNNIGNIYFYQSRYVNALESYENALKIVDESSGPWISWGRKLATGNIATLYQRIGLEQKALELYQQTSGRPEGMPVEEYAQALLNEGVLYRHLGDPIKALEVYRSSQALFRTAHHSDGEIGALRNIGIVEAMDLGDLQSASQSFTAALELSETSSNSRGISQANLYLGELLRRLGRYEDGIVHLNAAFAAAQKAGLVEEQWKALYALGQIAEQTGNSQAAVDDYQKAITLIESVRAGLRISLRNDFLADKRDVYDSVVALELQQPTSCEDEIFQWMERSRARTLLDRMAARTPLTDVDLKSVQSHLPPDTVLVEFWVGNQTGVAVWITPEKVGIARYASADTLRRETGRLLAALQMAGNQWKDLSRELGTTILAGIPLRRHMILAPDGPLNIPFEVLAIPGSEKLLIEQSDISYVPSARFLALPKASRPGWLFPWKRELVAFGDPPVFAKDALSGAEQWQPLQASAEEVHGIAKVLPGRTEIHLGADARKAYLLDGRLQGAPLLHLSTHALVDAEHPDRSRILLASDSAERADYLFQEEVNNLNLAGLDLVVVSACDTGRGKIVLGEGIQAFSQSFLGSGASATVTSMWRVADEPTAQFMKQFYYHLGRGVSKAEALQAAKLRFLRSTSDIASPRYWAAFVLNGDGWKPTVKVISWSTILLVLSALLATIGAVLWRIQAMVARTGRRTAPPSR